MLRKYPFPSHPNGWFAVGLSRELEPGGMLTRSCFDREIVLFRTASGTAHAMDAHCAHLGAHLGHGGSVRGDTIRCPLHGFCYDGAGHCVSTANGGPRAPGLRMATWPLRERNGLILVWHHAEGWPVAWEVPELDQEDRSPLLVERFEVRTYAQEVTENSIDIQHFSELHGYEPVRVVEELRADGPVLRAAFASARSVEELGAPGRAEFVFRVEAWGLGYVCVEAEDSVFGVRSRQFVLATPIDRERVAVRLAASITKFANPVLTERILARFFHGFISDVRQDIPIWEHKRYVETPAGAHGGENISAFRRWAGQFYSTPASDG